MNDRENGFLSRNIDEAISEIRNQNKDWFELAEEINIQVHKLLPLIRIDKKSAQEVYVIALLIRFLETFQGIVILAERGMAPETRILLRSLMELLFHIRAAVNDYSFVEEVISEDSKLRLKLMNKLRQCSDRAKEDLIDFPNTVLEKDLKDLITTRDIHEVKTWYVAKKANLLDYYNTAYSVFSQTVHTKARDLEEHIILNGTDTVQFKLGPTTIELDLYLLSAIECTFHILDSIIQFFKVENVGILDTLYKKFKELTEAYKTRQLKEYSEIKSKT